MRDYQQQLERVFLETRAAQAAPAASPTAYVDSTSDVAGHGGLEKPTAQALDDVSRPRDWRQTAISVDTLNTLGDAWVRPPDGFTVHPKLKALMDRRAAMVLSLIHI